MQGNNFHDLPVDLTLTRENAAERGYVWVCDVVEDAADDFLRVITTMVSAKHYTLGCASGMLQAKPAVGLYYRSSAPPTQPNTHEPAKQ